jgi:uncharacterized protein (TIGR03790 family)
LVAALAFALTATACSSDDSGSSARPDAGSGGAAGAGGAGGSAGNDAAAGSGGGAGAPVQPKVLLPKTALEPAELGLLVNDDDPASVAIADYYATARGIPTANIVHLKLPSGSVLSQADFATAKAAVDAALPASVQALVISWTQPYRVDCMSITSAFAFGFDTKHCNASAPSCGGTAASPYFDSDSALPFTDHAMRPTMMLAASSVDEAKALIDRGVSADNTFPSGNGWLVRTTDSARSVRWSAFLQTIDEWQHPEGLKLSYVDNSDGSGVDYIENQTDVLFYFTGLASVPAIDTNSYRPGAIADHVTSFGGEVPTSGQMSALEWLKAGATGSFGTVVEPCNFTSKFPDTRVLLRRYFRGASLLEAYWKSVATPGEGLFIGEPLARPWGETTVDLAGDLLTIVTTLLDPKKTYELASAQSENGPFTTVLTPIEVPNHQRATISYEPATAPVYRLAVAGQ